MSRGRRALQIAKEVLWGLFFYDFYYENLKFRARYNDAVNLLVFSEQVGLPLMNSYVAMRLLPYFVGDLENLGDKLDQAKRSYDGALNKFASGRGNVIRQAEMLKELGVKPTKQLPQKLVELSQDESPAGDVRRLAKVDVNAILVGEALVTSEDIGTKVRELSGTDSSSSLGQVFNRLKVKTSL